jgi:dipeptidyl aminopeptidase/acylaminoacyl peptidase
MRYSVASLLAASLFVAALVPAPAQPPTAAHLDELLASLNRGHRIGQVAVSPDGKRLAWVQGGEIHLAPLEDLSRSRRVTALSPTGPLCREGQLAWAPDSAALAFFSDCASPDAQDDLYIDRLDGSVPRRITELQGNAHSPVFAPDGRSIAFLYVPGATRPAGALAAMNLPSGVIGEDGIEIQRVAVASVASSKPVPPAIVTPATLHVYEFDWAPTSKALAYIAADPPGENNWWVARLYTQALGGAPTPILAPASVSGPLHGLQMAVPRWSPDGKSMAFIGGLMSDQGVTGGDVWLVPSAGGDPVNLTPGRPASVEWITWDDSRNLYLSELAGGDSRLTRLHIPDSPAGSATFSSTLFQIPATVRSGGLEMSLSATADRSLFVFGASSFSKPPEIFAARAKLPASVPSADTAPVAQLSHFNDGLQPGWGRAESLNWISEGFHVQGWLLLPKDYDPGKKYPMIVEVHGGPAYGDTSRWGGGGSLSSAAFSALGYFVLLPNPRGSFGQGEAFTQANRKDFGYGDLRDILAGVDAVTAKFPVDPNRVGITGWSYGGFMTMFAITQTHRFRAAVAGAGISDWLSYYGENSIDQWMIPFFGASVYEDPAVYAKSSAITYIKQASTPTLVVVGDRDGECPAPQSFEFWHALRDLHVPSRLVVYPNEGHGFSDPAHSRDVLERAIDWFARYMPPAP